ncbi:MAG: hypothetical protein IJF84_03945 [Thermoguttaceae bacterium]|nr:hypothetical protein [Thermoguttaceae bacterium]
MNKKTFTIIVLALIVCTVIVISRFNSDGKKTNEAGVSKTEANENTRQPDIIINKVQHWVIGSDEPTDESNPSDAGKKHKLKATGKPGIIISPDKDDTLDLTETFYKDIRQGLSLIWITFDTTECKDIIQVSYDNPHKKLADGIVLRCKPIKKGSGMLKITATNVEDKTDQQDYCVTVIVSDKPNIFDENFKTQTITFAENGEEQVSNPVSLAGFIPDYNVHYECTGITPENDQLSAAFNESGQEFTVKYTGKGRAGRYVLNLRVVPKDSEKLDKDFKTTIANCKIPYSVDIIPKPVMFTFKQAYDHKIESGKHESESGKLESKDSIKVEDMKSTLSGYDEKMKNWTTQLNVPDPGTSKEKVIAKLTKLKTNERRYEPIVNKAIEKIKDYENKLADLSTALEGKSTKYKNEFLTACKKFEDRLKEPETLPKNDMQERVSKEYDKVFEPYSELVMTLNQLNNGTWEPEQQKKAAWDDTRKYLIEHFVVSKNFFSAEEDTIWEECVKAVKDYINLHDKIVEKPEDVRDWIVKAVKAIGDLIANIVDCILHPIDCLCNIFGNGPSNNTDSGNDDGQDDITDPIETDESGPKQTEEEIPTDLETGDEQVEISVDENDNDAFKYWRKSSSKQGGTLIINLWQSKDGSLSNTLHLHVKSGDKRSDYLIDDIKSGLTMKKISDKYDTKEYHSPIDFPVTIRFSGASNLIQDHFGFSGASEIIVTWSDKDTYAFSADGNKDDEVGGFVSTLDVNSKKLTLKNDSGIVIELPFVGDTIVDKYNKGIESIIPSPNKDAIEIRFKDEATSITWKYNKETNTYDLMN